MAEEMPSAKLIDLHVSFISFLYFPIWVARLLYSGCVVVAHGRFDIRFYVVTPVDEMLDAWFGFKDGGGCFILIIQLFVCLKTVWFSRRVQTD